MVTDGWRPLCGAPAPLDDYASLLEPRGGWLLIDDTQAFGILGARSSPAGAWGNGGGGTLPYFGLSYPRTVAITSLAKAFGAPLAVMAGPRRLIRRFLRLSETRMFASPPSEANLAAARRALSFNAAEGDEARSRLRANVRYFTTTVPQKNAS